MHLKHLCLDKAFTFLLFDPSTLGLTAARNFQAREVVVKDYLVNKGQVYVKGEVDDKTLEINVPYDADTMTLSGIYESVNDIPQAIVVPEDPAVASDDESVDDEGASDPRQELVAETV
jgi:hypothetical protein